jgi:hypothetical protein
VRGGSACAACHPLDGSCHPMWWRVCLGHASILCFVSDPIPSLAHAIMIHFHTLSTKVLWYHTRYTIPILLQLWYHTHYTTSTHLPLWYHTHYTTSTHLPLWYHTHYTTSTHLPLWYHMRCRRTYWKRCLRRAPRKSALAQWSARRAAGARQYEVEALVLQSRLGKGPIAKTRSRRRGSRCKPTPC